MNFKPSFYFLGLSCLPIALMSLLNIFYSFYFNYLKNLNSYLAVLVISIIISISLIKIGKKDKDKISIYGQLFLIFLIYFFMSFLILIPYLFGIYNISFIDSYFEAISGLTSTGFTVINNINILDDPLILWRSSSQWVGSFYFLIFLVLIFSNKQINFKMIDLSYIIEKKINFSSNLIGVTYRIFFIYLSLTVLIFLLFLFSGIRLFDGMNLSLTIISSGGFLPVDSLENIIRNNFQSFLLCITFLIPILNFYLFYNIFLARNNLKYHKEDIYLIILIIIFSIIFYFFNDAKILEVFINILSSISTSGISIGSVPENFGLYFIISSNKTLNYCIWSVFAGPISNHKI